MSTLIIGDDDGLPQYILDVDLITSEGGKLAVQLAAIAGNGPEVEAVLQAALIRLGPDAFAHVAASALSIMSTSILGGALDLTAAQGLDLRPGLQRIADTQS